MVVKVNGMGMLKIDPRRLKELLFEVYQDVIKEDAQSFVIRCPWHQPDNNPSCVVFKTGVFYCPVCHGDKPKGKRGVSPYLGFKALGMPEDRARRLFITGGDTAPTTLHAPRPSLASYDTPFVRNTTPKVLEEKITARSPWPKDWGFRDIEYETMIAPWFTDRFAPTKVTLKKERIPRLALAVGGAGEFKPDKKLRHEVYLRLSSAVKPKAANSVGLRLDPEVPGFANLFGLINNRLCEDCKGVFIVEGPYDALLTHQHLYALGGGYEVIALLGSPQWSSCLKQIQESILPQMKQNNIPFILAFDNDPVGFKLTHNAIKDLQTSCYLPKARIKILAYPLSIKDPGELSLETFSLCFKKCIENKIEL